MQAKVHSEGREKWLGKEGDEKRSRNDRAPSSYNPLCTSVRNTAPFSYCLFFIAYCTELVAN